MKIAIDIRPLSGPLSGVGAYCRNLLLGLAALPHRHEYFLCSNKKPDLPPNLDERFFDDHHPFPIGNLWLQARLPRRLGELGVGCFHGTNFLAPLASPCPTVITVHDLSSFLMPEMHTRANNLAQRALPMVLKRARRIIAISHTTQKAIESHFGIDPGRIRVVPNAVADGFRPINDPEKVAALRKRFLLPEHFILFVGTLEPRKNVEGLLHAFARLIEKTGLPHHLVLAGPEGWGAKSIHKTHAALGLGGRVRFLGYMPDPWLPVLYNAAHAFAFVSHYEGFGLPVLEAMSCGAPTVISDDPSLVETAGGAALITPRKDIGAVADALERILTDEGERQRLGAAGIARAKDFSIQRFALGALKAYEEAAEES